MCGRMALGWLPGQLALGGLVELAGLVVRAPPEVLHAVARVVGGDAIQPRRELGVAAEGVDVLEDGHEHLLRHVLGLLADADHAEDDVEDLVLVEAHDLGERALVPLLQATDQHAFAKRRHGERCGVTAHASLDHPGGREFPPPRAASQSMKMRMPSMRKFSIPPCTLPR